MMLNLQNPLAQQLRKVLMHILNVHVRDAGQRMEDVNVMMHRT